MTIRNFTESENSLIASALRIAAEKYNECVRTLDSIRMDPNTADGVRLNLQRSAQQFQLQASQATELAEMFD